MENETRVHIVSPTGAVRYSEARTEDMPRSTDFEAHIHTGELEIYHFPEGDVSFVFEGRKIIVEPGHIIVVAAGVYHRPIINRTSTYHRRHIYLSRRAFFGLGAGALEVYHRACRRKIIALAPSSARALGLEPVFDRVREALASGGEYGESAAIIHALSLLISADASGVSDTELKLTPYSERIWEMLKYVNANITADLRYTELAERFGISEKSLYKLFKRETGTTPARYILERRISTAESVLSAGGSAAEAARLSGFSDYAVFYRAFVREVGMTPREYVQSVR
ncbi:MAG: helix-turn-helix transcriptional regulator [Clostridia bacterium]|nr:helix-turn-helix transcriptional regulator [Clostridia bacterium]